MGLLTDYYGDLGKLVAAPEPRVPTRDSQNALGRKAYDPNKASIAEALLSFSPVLGDVLSAKDTAASLSEGNYGKAALNGVGLLPFVPSLAGSIKPATKKLFRGEYPYIRGNNNSGAVGANSADLYSKGVGRGDFWTTDREMAEYWAGNKKLGGYVLEADLAPNAKELTLITPDGEFDRAGIDVFKQAYPRLRNATDEYLFNHLMENGIVGASDAIKKMGYDVVHSMDLDGPETLVLNHSSLTNRQKLK